MTIEAIKLALQYIEANAETQDEHEIAEGLRQVIAEIEKRNFCSRCGKKLGKNNWDIHTCTPPLKQEQDNAKKNKAWNYTLDIECEKCETKESGILSIPLKDGVDK
jgi:Zn finger protein HypA/HybF involved in hydrogenase expression